MSRSITEIAQAASGVILAVAGVLAALGTLKEKAQPILEWLGIAQLAWIPWVLTGILLMAGLWLLSRGLSRKSKLLQPERLLIDPDDPRHLRGRTDEIRLLRDAVARPLVFLEGESGCGKSALIRSGLIPALRDQRPDAATAPALLPVYLNIYGDDWDQGLRDRLADATWAALGPELRGGIGIESIEDLRKALLPGNPSLFRRIRDDLGVIPLLVFDQFDDYLMAHRGRFLSAGRWIAANELTAGNATWRRLEEELGRDACHLLFVTRRDLFAGLEAVRFVKPEVLALDRVEPAYIAALLDTLTEPGSDDRPVIADPDAGWETFKGRLIRDLSARGRVLPIQARVVFRGLTELPDLGVAAYERRGGIQGLEAAYIESAAAAAASAAGIPADRVLDALLMLVDETAPDLPKARGADEALLASKVALPSHRLDRMLGVLRQEGVIRPRLPSGSGDTRGTWSLYHDYLARAVLAVARRAEHWQRLLQERLAAFETATNWRSRWRALLSPWELASLAWPSLRGKVRWAGFRRFGLRSTLRLVPLVAVLSVALLGGDQALDWQARQEAGQILSVIRAGDPVDKPKGEELRQLWALAAGDMRLKQAFVERALTGESVHETLLAHLDAVTQALFGLDVGGRLRVWTFERLSSADLSPIVWARLAPRVEELAGLGERLPADQVQAVALRLLADMAATADPKQLGVLGKALAGLGERLPAEQAEAVALHLVEAMAATADPRQLEVLAEVLVDLGARLPAEQARAGALRLVEVMAATADTWELHLLGQALAGLCERLPAEPAPAVAVRLTELMAATADPKRLGALGEALAGLGGRLPFEQARAGAVRLTEVMADTADPEQLTVLGRALGRLTQWQWTDGPAEAGALRLLEVMAETVDAGQLGELGEALDGLCVRLPGEQAQAVALRLVEVIAATAGPQHLGSLLEVLVDLGAHLPGEQVQTIALRLVEVMHATANPWQLAAVGWTLAGFGERLPAEPVQAHALRLAEAMAVTADPEQLELLAEVLVDLGARLPGEQVQAIALRLVELTHATADPLQLAALGGTLAGLGERLPAELEQGIAVRLREAMAETTDAEQLGVLGEALVGNRAPLTDEQARAVALHLVGGMAETTNPWQLGALAEALAGLGNHLPPEPARAAAQRLVDVMLEPDDSRDFANLAKVLNSIPVPPDSIALESAPDLLQAPLAYGEARTHLLKYYSRAAETELKTLDEFVAWARQHRPALDLSRPPRNPFR